MSSSLRRRVVEQVFEGGEPPRPAIQVESNFVEEEYELSDTMGISLRPRSWSKCYVHGGPFRRRPGEGLGEWADRVHQLIDSLELPLEDIEQMVKSAGEFGRKYRGDRFIVCKVLGPTEASEMLFAPPVPQEYLDMEQIWHRYDFMVFLRLRQRKALELYDRLAEYVLEVVKALGELDEVDAIRVADDVADYRGPMYPSYLLERYIYWHSSYAEAIRARGKHPLLHCDGDITQLLQRLNYRGYHPLDLVKRAGLEDVYKWYDRILELRRSTDAVFMTGIPIELIFNDLIDVEELVNGIKHFVERHGLSLLVLSTTHRPYPKRGYGEVKQREKILAIRKSFGAL